MKLNRITIITAVIVAASFLSNVAFAEDGAGAMGNQAYMAIGAGLAMGLAVLGGGLGQGIAVRGGLEGIARNPQAASVVQTAMLLGLAFVESLVIFSLIMAMFINGTISI